MKKNYYLYYKLKKKNFQFNQYFIMKENIKGLNNMHSL